MNVTWLQNPQKRRQLLSITSGLLILAGLAAGRTLQAAPGVNGRLVADALMIAAAVIAGMDIAQRAYLSLRSRHISIELLVTIATLGALAIGEYWEAAAVTFLFIFGAYLEARTLSRTRQVLRELLDLAPTTAIVLREERQVELLAHEVEVGEIVLVKPGSKIPVDGEVIAGHAAVDESAITGEPIPEEKVAGSAVFAGTINQNGLLKIRTTGAGADTTLARIVRRVEEAQEEKAPTQRFIERFARWYTPAIIGGSALLFLITRDIELSLTLLVISCPGALVISTPVSVIAGIGRAAKSGILIKGGEYLENSGKITALALDKTGTITRGQPVVTDVLVLSEEWALAGEAAAGASAGDDGYLARESLPGALPGSRFTDPEQEVIRWAAIAESSSEHPLARAIMEEGEEVFDGPIPHPDEFASWPGKGIQAIYQGHTIAVGTTDLMEDQGIPVGETVIGQLDRLKRHGKTSVLVSLDGRLLGILGIADPLRESSPAMIRRLKQVGLKKIVMLTGDDRLTAEAIAAEAGIKEVHSDLLPEDKLAIIRDLQAAGYVVAMTGDGINDAPALAAADIGIAMGAAGTSIAIETADIALMADDLMKIPEAIRLSKAALRNIRQNFTVALVTVAALLVGVLLGEVHMAEGMLIHEASVLIVILNGMRLLRT
ncbi:MAG TPA: cation-translocating P-type ATPase [Anaerolineales bacterium]